MINAIVIEYQDIGFSMNVKRMNQWYNLMKHIPNGEFVRMVETLLYNHNRNPRMADIYNLRTKEPDGLPKELYADFIRLGYDPRRQIKEGI